jgi:hypothetical protein
MPSKSVRLRAALSLPPSAICVFGPAEEPCQWKIQEFGGSPRYLSPGEVSGILAAQPRAPHGGYRHGTPGGKAPKGGKVGRPKKAVEPAS